LNLCDKIQRRNHLDRQLMLTQNLRVYLTGFYKRGIQPKTGKNTQKTAQRRHRGLPFTMPALTIAFP
jgi:hypothetical protein